ncbi:protein of unknown function [Agromyces cerinus subsp. cerinus]|uniref:Bacteriocin-protection, YdeI or OmpD-Associated n=2 Tax=Agromyces cerinus TaxID=33878 RepID=A0A1N6EZ67_9MICO|nr:protein of unknown function [Agromyces cerinus subsp. cerinus]
MSQVGNNTGIEVPPEVIEALGAGKKPPVVVNVNGYEYRSTVAVMGGRFMISFSSDKRAATGIGGGDPIVVDLELDTAPRTVEVPDDLAAALETAGARAAFDALSPSAKQAHVTAVEGAKAAETRQRRIDGIVAKLTG